MCLSRSEKWRPTLQLGSLPVTASALSGSAGRQTYCTATEVCHQDEGQALCTDLGGIFQAGRAIIDSVDGEGRHSLLLGVLEWVQLDVVIAIEGLELLNQVLDGVVVSFAGNNTVATLRCVCYVLEVLGVTKETLDCDSVLKGLL
jgi:hypothetical protein